MLCNQFILFLSVIWLGCAVPARAMPQMPSAAPFETYLASHIAQSDKLALGARIAAVLHENAELTRKAVNAAPWRETLTPALVCQYILPLRVTQEPLEPWRPYLAQTLEPVIWGVRTPLEAAYALRRWLCARVRPGASHEWDLGPLALLRIGSGRCEELGILFVCSARAVGLPARICMTPLWRDVPGNHLWVEVWDGSAWRILSPEQPDAPADTGWFLPHAAKAGLVLAKGFGPPPADEVILKHDATGFWVNRTPAYALCGRLRVRVVPKEYGGQAGQGDVTIRLYARNGAKVRELVKLRGPQELALGTGTYVVAAETEKSFACALAEVRPDAVTTITLRPELLPSGRALPKEEDLLASPGPTGQRARKEQYGAGDLPLADALFNQWQGFVPSGRVFRATGPGPAAIPLPKTVETWGAWLDSTSRAYASREAVAAEEALALAAWRRMYPLDENRPEARARFEREILPGRVGKEPFSHWRQALADRIAFCVRPGDPGGTRRCLRAWADALPMVTDGKRQIYGAPLSLLTIAEQGVVTSKEEREWAFTAAVRAAGVYAHD